MRVRPTMSKSIEELKIIAKRIRREIIEMIGAAKSGHPGGSLSAVEIVVELYFNRMRIDPKNPKWADRDRFVLSQGHAAPVLYAAMAEAGYADTPPDQLNTLRPPQPRLGIRGPPGRAVDAVARAVRRIWVGMLLAGAGDGHTGPPRRTGLP